MVETNEANWNGIQDENRKTLGNVTKEQLTESSNNSIIHDWFKAN